MNGLKSVTRPLKILIKELDKSGFNLLSRFVILDTIPILFTLPAFDILKPFQTNYPASYLVANILSDSPRREAEFPALEHANQVFYLLYMMVCLSCENTAYCLRRFEQSPFLPAANFAREQSERYAKLSIPSKARERFFAQA